MAAQFPRLLSLLSHELRGPLGVIRGYLRMLDQFPDMTPDQVRQAMASTLGASDRLAEILDQASLLAHLEIGDAKIERTRIPLPSLLREAVNAVTLPADAQASLALLDVPPVEIHADAARMRSALAALVFAVARAQGNAVIVELSTTLRRSGSKAGVLLRIEPRTLPPTKSREVEFDTRRGGLGLTLPIAATVIRAHRGTVKDLRHRERSTGVIVWLPIAAPRARERILRRRRLTPQP